VLFVSVGIPAQNCSFPFTYSGSLYYSCVQNASNKCECKCLVGRRVWMTVAESTGKSWAHNRASVSVWW